MEMENRSMGKFKVLIVNEKVDLYNLSEFKKALLPLTEQNPYVAVQLKENRHELCSSVIGALISGKKRISDTGSFVLINSSESISALLAMSGLSRFFTTVEDISELP